MPKQTFFNLPEQKRKNIEQAALDEFAEHGFDASNMNRIVEQSQIAKGSFYQYFEDKMDLYLHLIDCLFKRKIEYIEPVMKNYRKHSFADNLKELMRLSLAFSADVPKLHRLGEDFFAIQRSFPYEQMQKYRAWATDVYTALLTQADENGELAEDMSIPSLSFFISSLINQTVISFMTMESKASREAIVNEMLTFINRAVINK